MFIYMSISYFSPIVLSSDSPTSLPFQSKIQIPLVQTIPIVTTINPIVAFPIHPSFDLNNDKEFRKKTTKYIYYKTLDKWLKKENEMLDLLNYLKVTDKDVRLIDNLQEYNSNNIDRDNQSTIDKKVEFIEKYILSLEDIYNILKKFTRETSINWYDVHEKGTQLLKDIIKKFIKKKLEEAIKNKNNS